MEMIIKVILNIIKFECTAFNLSHVMVIKSNLYIESLNLISRCKVDIKHLLFL